MVRFLLSIRELVIFNGFQDVSMDRLKLDTMYVVANELFEENWEIGKL